MVSSLPQTTSQWIIRDQTGFQALQYESSVPIPALGDHDCLIKIGAVALNYRDLAIANNQYPLPCEPPFVPTCDGAGTILAVGSRVRTFKPGDRVCPIITPTHLYGRLDHAKQSTTLGGGHTDGPLREYVVYEDSTLVSIPRHLSLVEASTLPGAAVTAWNTIFGSDSVSSAVTPIKPGDTVLTQGTGGVSLFAVQFAVAAGATVIATTSSSSGRKVDLLKKLGVKHVIDYTADANWGETARNLTPNGVGVDHVVDVVGVGTLEQSLKAVRYEGTVSVVGFLSGFEGGLGPGLLSTLLRAVTVRGVLGGSKLQFEEMNRAIERLEIKPVVDDRVFTLREVPQAYQYLSNRRHVGKVVVKIP